MSLKDLIFNKGGIGVSLSRQETVERINPLIRKHVVLNHYYDYAIAHLSDRELVERLNAFQKLARVDVGKLSETVLSAGGVAYNGTDVEPGDFTLDGDDDDMLFRLLDLEEDFQNALDAELELNHQIRTQAVLGVLQKNGRERLDFLREMTRKRHRKVSTAAS